MKKRVEWIDIYRGIGILIMIMGHVGFGNLFSKVTHSFHMPIWFFISGLLYRNSEEAFGVYFKRKFKSLMIPWFVNLLIYYLVWVIFESNQVDNLNRLKSLGIMLIGGESPIPGGVQWFLSALFIAMVLYHIIETKFKQYDLFIIIFFAVLGSIYKKYLGLPVFWSFDAAFVALGFIHVGHLMTNIITEEKINSKWYKVLLLGLLLLAISILNGNVNMRVGDYAIIPLFWMAAFIGIFFMIYLSMYIDKMSKYPLFDKSLKLVKHIGRDSIVFLCCNQIVIMFIKRNLMPLLNITKGSVVERILSFCFTIMIIYVIDLVYYAIKISLLNKLNKS